MIVFVKRITDYCGHGVPLMEFTSDRDLHERWVKGKPAKRGSGWKAVCIDAKNAASIDGLPGVDAERHTAG